MVTVATSPAGPFGRPVRPTPVASRAPGRQRISGAFQLALGLYIVLTGEFPTIVQAIAFGAHGDSGSEFYAAMVTALVRDLMMLAPVIILANNRLGILHPLLVAVVIWPLLIGMPSMIQEVGGWAGILAGLPLETPRFIGLPTQSHSVIWGALAKYNGLEIAALASIYFGFWSYTRRRRLKPVSVILPDPAAARTVLLGLVAISTVVLLVFLYWRGGLDTHLTSLAYGRFRELAGFGPIIVATQLGVMAVYVWTALRPNDVKSPLFLLSLGAVVAAQFVSNGARTSALMVPMTVGLIWALRTQRVPWRTGLLLIPVLFVSLGLMSATRTAGWGRESATQVVANAGWAESFALAQQEIELRRSMKAQAPIIERGFEVAGGPLLGLSYVAAAAAFIPRAIWENKPRGPDSLYAQLFLRESKQGQAIPVTPTAEMYWNFGVPGVILLMFVYGWLLHAAYNFWVGRSSSPFATVFYALFLTTFQLATERLVPFQQALLLLAICYMAIALLAPKHRYVAAPLRSNQPRQAVPTNVAGSASGSRRGGELWVS